MAVANESFSDPVEIRRRIKALVRRIDRRDDYGKLLAQGSVIRDRAEIDDLDGWRAELRRQARADKIKIRTGATDGIVYGVLVDAATAERKGESDRYWAVTRRVVPLAVAHSHEPEVTARDGDEAIFNCAQCPALGYADAADGTIGGPLFEDDCPEPTPPKTTALSFMC